MDSLEIYEILFNSSPDGIIIVDQKGNIIMANLQVEKLFGYKKHELIGQEIEFLVAKRFQKNYTKYRNNYFGNPSVQEKGATKELWAQKKNGDELAVEISLSPIKLKDRLLISATIRDITENKLAEKKTIEAERMFHRTLDNMLEGVQIIGFDWTYLYVNNAFCVHAKYSKEELLAHTVLEMYPGIEKTEVFKIYQRCFDERIHIFMENKFEFPDGSIGWFKLHFEPVQEGILILSIDITDRKKAEEIKEQHISGLEEMIFLTSHKVRQPIANILGLASILDESVNEPHEVKKIVDYMKHSALNLDIFTHELNDFIHQEKRKTEKKVGIATDLQ
jgi:PAS domain S-box-containing protein